MDGTNNNFQGAVQGKAMLFDANALMANSKDVSAYVAESIRNIYGIALGVDLKEYKGMTSKETARAILLSHGLDGGEIDERLDRYIEDLPYSYYNTAWSDRVFLASGATNLLQELKKKGIILGIISGEIERIVREKMKKTNIDEYFDIVSSGDTYEDMAGILKSAVENASEHGMEEGKVLSIAGTARMLSALKAAGIYTIGMEEIREESHNIADLYLKSLDERQKIISAIERL